MKAKGSGNCGLWRKKLQEFICLLSMNNLQATWLHFFTTTTTCLMVLYPCQPGWAKARRNIHSLTSCLCRYYTTPLINFLHFLRSTKSFLHNCLHFFNALQKVYVWFTVLAAFGGDTWHKLNKTHTVAKTKYCLTKIINSTFSALTLLVGWQEGHPACKNWVVRYWRGNLSAARCKWLAYGPADATATLSSRAPVKSRTLIYFSGASLSGCPGKKLLNGCSSSSSSSKDN